MPDTTKLKLGIKIISKVGLVEKKDGEQRFIRFKENGHKWLKEDYEHEGAITGPVIAPAIAKIRTRLHELLIYNTSHFIASNYC